MQKRKEKYSFFIFIASVSWLLHHSVQRRVIKMELERMWNEAVVTKYNWRYWGKPWNTSVRIAGQDLILRPCLPDFLILNCVR
jgi:hypothetical protein